VVHYVQSDTEICGPDSIDRVRFFTVFREGARLFAPQADPVCRGYDTVFDGNALPLKLEDYRLRLDQ